MSTLPTRKIRCPECKKETIYSLDNSFRPFCSERCRLIDLGQWADESFRVPVKNDNEDSTWNHPDEDEDTP